MARASGVTTMATTAMQSTMLRTRIMVRLLDVGGDPRIGHPSKTNVGSV
jgi:hypothetical protein